MFNSTRGCSESLVKMVADWRNWGLELLLSYSIDTSAVSPCASRVFDNCETVHIEQVVPPALSVNVPPPIFVNLNVCWTLVLRSTGPKSKLRSSTRTLGDRELAGGVDVVAEFGS